ncbi:hypothetical protein D3C75_266750 [compost metagenome]
MADVPAGQALAQPREPPGCPFADVFRPRCGPLAVRLTALREPQRHKRGFVALVLQKEPEPPVRRLLIRLEQLQHRPERRSVRLPADRHQPALLIQAGRGCAAAEQQRELAAQVAGFGFRAVIALEDRCREGGAQTRCKARPSGQSLQCSGESAISFGQLLHSLFVPMPLQLAFAISGEGWHIPLLCQQIRDGRSQLAQQGGITLPAPAYMSQQLLLREERDNLLSRQHDQIYAVCILQSQLGSVEGLFMPGEQELLQLDAGNIVIPVIDGIDQGIAVLGQGQLDR